MFFIDVPSVSVYSLVTGQLYVGCRKLAHTVAKLVGSTLLMKGRSQ